MGFQSRLRYGPDFWQGKGANIIEANAFPFKMHDSCKSSEENVLVDIHGNNRISSDEINYLQAFQFLLLIWLGFNTFFPYLRWEISNFECICFPIDFSPFRCRQLALSSRLIRKLLFRLEPYTRSSSPWRSFSFTSDLCVRRSVLPLSSAREIIRHIKRKTFTARNRR